MKIKPKHIVVVISDKKKINTVIFISDKNIFLKLSPSFKS